MTLEENKDLIVAHAVALRAAQKLRLGAVEDSGREAAKNLEFLARKKLNELVDLYEHKLAKAADAPEKER